MRYEGKLYGKVGRKTIPLMLNSHDVDQMEREITRLRDALRSVNETFSLIDGGMARNARYTIQEALRTDHK